jgi:hypothetical protein
LTLDTRPARLLLANGLALAGDPLGAEGAKAWRIGTARPLPGSRPFPLALTDYGFAATDDTLIDLAAGQAQWLLYGLPLGWIEATANLGVELYDVVTVDTLRARLVGIAETWERRGVREQRLPPPGGQRPSRSASTCAMCSWKVRWIKL